MKLRTREVNYSGDLIPELTNVVHYVKPSYNWSWPVFLNVVISTSVVTCGIGISSVFLNVFLLLRDVRYTLAYVCFLFASFMSVYVVGILCYNFRNTFRKEICRFSCNTSIANFALKTTSLCILFICVTPIMRTLTSSHCFDSLWTLSLLNCFGYSICCTLKLRTLSIGCATFATAILVSRLHDPMRALSFLFMSLSIFSVLPIIFGDFSSTADISHLSENTSTSLLLEYSRKRRAYHVSSSFSSSETHFDAFRARRETPSESPRNGTMTQAEGVEGPSSDEFKEPVSVLAIALTAYTAFLAIFLTWYFQREAVVPLALVLSFVTLIYPGIYVFASGLRTRILAPWDIASLSPK